MKATIKNLIQIAANKGIAVSKTNDGKGNQYSFNGYEWITFNGTFNEFFKFISAL